MKWTDKAQKYLKKYWNIANLKDKQIEVINELLLGNDVIGLLPTGYGKSMCYMLPALLTKRVILIISPLISLIDDQKEKLDKIGIPSAALHGNNLNKNQEIFDIMNNKIKIIYISPEYLIKSDGLELAQTLVNNNKLGYLAIDEAHCVSSWGHDFRPEYTKINVFREMFPKIPILAVTATATETVCQDIHKSLALKNPIIIRASFDRPNLYLKIQEIPYMQITKTKKKMIPKETLALEYVKKYPNDKIIIYVNSRKETEELTNELNKLIKNISGAYHAGLNRKTREDIQTKFINGDIKVIVSTIAFGMGVDQCVRCVLIFGSPSAIEEYYQQIGRAGRDSQPAETILYFNYSNLIIAKYMLKDIKTKYPSLYNVKLNNLNKVDNLVHLNTCRRKYILEYFGESCNFFTCNNCDNCCEEKLVDMTNEFWSILMKPKCNLATAVNEIRNKFLSDINKISNKNKDITISLELLEPLKKWKNYVIENKLSINNLPDNLKIKIPEKFIKKEITIINNDDFDYKINSYIKLII
jgi:RecQ family ATP-dependent DNA helicase